MKNITRWFLIMLFMLVLLDPISIDAPIRIQKDSYSLLSSVVKIVGYGKDLIKIFI